MAAFVAFRFVRFELSVPIDGSCRLVVVSLDFFGGISVFSMLSFQSENSKKMLAVSGNCLGSSTQPKLSPKTPYYPGVAFAARSEHRPALFEVAFYGAPL